MLFRIGEAVPDFPGQVTAFRNSRPMGKASGAPKADTSGANAGPTCDNLNTY
jgi:hypothetical protein